MSCENSMRRNLHGELVRDGVICAEPCSQNLPWEQVVAQAPRFFELRHQGMKDPSRSSFGIFVLQEVHLNAL